MNLLRRCHDHADARDEGSRDLMPWPEQHHVVELVARCMGLEAGHGDILFGIKLPVHFREQAGSILSGGPPLAMLGSMAAQNQVSFGGVIDTVAVVSMWDHQLLVIVIEDPTFSPK